MNALTVDQILSAAEASGFKVNRRTGYMQCPSHRGHDLNCHVYEGEKGGAMAKCHSHGCAWPDIKSALGLDTSKARAQTRQNRPEGADGSKATPKTRIVSTYDYEDESGELRYQTVRTEPGPNGKPKGFYQRRPDGKGDWENNLNGVDPLPYRLPEILASTDLVLVVEGEKDVDRLRAEGFTVTCNHGGAGKWTATHAAYLAGRDVVVIPDNDEPGEQHAAHVVETLHGTAKSIRLVRLACEPGETV